MPIIDTVDTACLHKNLLCCFDVSVFSHYFLTKCLLLLLKYISGSGIPLMEIFLPVIFAISTFFIILNKVQMRLQNTKREPQHP